MEDHRSEFRLAKMCKVMEVSKSGYFKWRTAPKSERKLHKEKLVERVHWHFVDTDEIYGSPKITNELWKEGWKVSERTVGQIMREHGLRSCTVKKFKVQTTDSNHDNPIAPNLLDQDFSSTTAPNQVWVTDITYVPCREGKLYLACVMDLFTRKIVGWQLMDRMTNELVLEALAHANKTKAPSVGLIHHSDRGSQYTSSDYRDKLLEYNMIASMSRKGNCYDNACIESFHSLIKKELIYRYRFKTKKEARERIFRYIEFFYNRKRTHSYLNYMSPDRFEAMYYSNAL
nr:IS3 family transposase [Paenibacillus eucommiae]